MRLVPYVEAVHAQQIAGFHLPVEQTVFSLLPQMAVAVAKENDRMHPVLLVEDAMLIAFFILQEEGDILPYVASDNAVLFRSFSINYSDQGKGYAKATLKLLTRYVQTCFRASTEIVLTVHHLNERAIQLYLANGFRDTKQVQTSAHGDLLIFSKVLPVIK